MILAAHHLVGGLARGSSRTVRARLRCLSTVRLVERSSFTDVINVGKLLLKYLLQHMLPNSTDANRVGDGTLRSLVGLHRARLVVDAECNQVAVLFPDIPLDVRGEGMR